MTASGQAWQATPSPLRWVCYYLLRRHVVRDRWTPDGWPICVLCGAESRPSR